tara:strand:- start:240 stop:611 length:372 start_codon:yes stop_codon:yes gene_type:complete
MIDTDKYDNEGIELSDGGTICFPEDDGRIQRIDKDGNTMQTLHPEDTEWQEWYELFDTQKDLLAEVKRLRGELESIQNSMAWTVQVWWNENYMGRQDWMEQMCEIYTDLAKGIEAQYHGEEEE